MTTVPRCPDCALPIPWCRGHGFEYRPDVEAADIDVFGFPRRPRSSTPAVMIEPDDAEHPLNGRIPGWSGEGVPRHMACRSCRTYDYEPTEPHAHLCDACKTKLLPGTQARPRPNPFLRPPWRR